MFKFLQSFGVVGYWTAKFLTEKGAKLIGVLEYEGGIYNENGKYINIEN